jgi:hypothetical protein
MLCNLSVCVLCPNSFLVMKNVYTKVTISYLRVDVHTLVKMSDMVFVSQVGLSEVTKIMEESMAFIFGVECWRQYIFWTS